MNTSEFPSLQEENHLKVLRLLEANPQLSQRDLAVALGLTSSDTSRLNQLLSNAASQHVKPPSGIPRAVAAWPELELIDDRQGNQFKVVIKRGERQPGQTIAPQVTPQVAKLLQAITGDMTRQALMDTMGLKDRKHFVDSYLKPALSDGLVELTIPGKPNSRLQKYRLSAVGSACLHATQIKNEAR